jgi:hypothetical protein
MLSGFPRAFSRRLLLLAGRCYRVAVSGGKVKVTFLPRFVTRSFLDILLLLITLHLKTRCCNGTVSPLHLNW